MLVSSNGRSVVGYDVDARRVKSFLEHPYQARSDGSHTRNLAYDLYSGLRVGGAGQPGTWLTEVAPARIDYETGTGVIVVEREVQGLKVIEYLYAPIELAEHAMFSILSVERTSGAPQPVDGYTLFNFRLGSGSPSPGAEGETIAWDDDRQSWLEWGPGGLTLAYGSFTPVARRSASPDNPFPALDAGADLSNNDGTGGGFDDAAAGLQWSLGSLDVGQTGWFGSFVVLDAASDVAPRIDAVKAFVAGRSPEQLLSDEKAAWDAWHESAPSGLSSLEAALYRHSMAILRMGQVSEPGKSDGQILASLPPGMWNISWVRDMAYAVVALARSGHHAEVKRALAFQLGAESGKYQEYVGHPYQISITRYYGDGVEETDFNEDGPNIEFDGFGLFLWTLHEYVEASNDSASLSTWWPEVSSKIGDVLVKLQEPSGLIAPDSSIWEVHWNGKQKRFAYTTITAANGLCRAAKLAERVGDAERAQSYLAAGRKARDAVVSQLSAPDGTIAQSLEELNAGHGFLDAAAIEAVGLGLVNPKGRAAQATLASMKAALVPPSGRGFFRNDDGGWYDSQEWVFVDLRTAQAMRKSDDSDRTSLVQWITDQGAENFNLISELHDAVTADYRGEMPMVGFGAGAYAIVLWDRVNPDDLVPCGDFAPEAQAPGSGGAGGGAAKPKAADDDGGCGCQLAGSGESRALLGAWLLAALWLRRWLRPRDGGAR